MFNREKLIAAMEAAGYWFDDIDSYDNSFTGCWLVFRGDYGVSIDFSSWENVYDWLRGVDFDDPAVSDAVEKILN